MGLIILITVFFKKNIFLEISFKKKKYLNKIFLIIIPIFLVWFLKHPSLRYGGYIIFSLLVFFSFALFVKFKLLEIKVFEKKIFYLIILCIIYFNVSNIIRINDEINSHHIFKYSNFPFYALDENLLRQDKLRLLNSKYKIINNYKFYLNAEHN